MATTHLHCGAVGSFERGALAQVMFCVFSLTRAFGSAVEILPTNSLQVTSATNGSAAECAIVEEEPWKHE